jgi:hypothetical protein
MNTREYRLNQNQDASEQYFLDPADFQFRRPSMIRLVVFVMSNVACQPLAVAPKKCSRSLAVEDQAFYLDPACFQQKRPSRLACAVNSATYAVRAR